MSEMGFTQAIIQSQNQPTSQDISRLQKIFAIRGAVAFLLTFLALYIIERAGKINLSTSSILLVSSLPLIKSMSSLGIAIKMKSLSFKYVFRASATASLLEVLIFAALFIYRPTIQSAVTSFFVIELAKFTLSHAFYPVKIFCFPEKFNSDLIQFSKGIWGNSVASLLVNQFDKIASISLMNSNAIAIYQTGSRLAQSGLSDIGVAMGQRAYSVFSANLDRGGVELNNQYAKLYNKMSIIYGLTASIIILFAKPLIEIVLGSQWSGAVLTFCIATLSSFNGSLISLSVALLRSLNKANHISIVTIYQLIVMILSIYILITLGKEISSEYMVSISALAVFFACIALHSFSISESRKLHELFKVLFINTILVFEIIIVHNYVWKGGI